MAPKRIRMVDMKTLVTTGRSDVYARLVFVVFPMSS
ncbi:hypothetical protein TorRG33x02_106240 [Trema orientale]|uniref:Uncharacterized protein n=1 Tax=Trema orientale TaxID=63057 RepID=A0A2P5F764_TREOI|nr:hypothetical protein TorRG33x02_106240 [Trema orientale]